MGDARMRAAVARYTSTLRFHQQSVVYLRQLLPRLEEHAGFRYELNPETRRTRQLVDLEQVRSNPLVMSKLALATNVQGIALVLRQRNLKRAIEMCSEIGRVAGTNCRLDRPPPSFD